MSSRFGRTLAAVAVMATLCLAACSGNTGGDGVDVQHHLDYDTAHSNAVSNAHRSASVLPTGARLRLALDSDVPCSDSDGAPPSTPVSIQASWDVLGVPSSGVSHAIADVVRFWLKQGWQVTTDERPGDQFVTLASNGYEVVLQAAPEGRFALSTTSPCVAPKGSSP